MDKLLLKQVLLENQKEIVRYVVNPRECIIDDYPCHVMVGVRRSGKSYMLYHIIQEMLKQGKSWSEIAYLNFEDERLIGFGTEDFNKILECYQEMYGKSPVLLLDEIQNVPQWEKFARRMADTQYTVYITGSNARMLSGEINTTLGGRYMVTEVYPYSFKEFLGVHNIPFDELSLLTTNGRGAVLRLFDEYLHDGGLPAAAMMPVRRNYLSSVFQKIYLGDIIARNKVTNVAGIHIMVRKLAESVCRPISYNRLNSLLSSVGGKLSLATTIKYIEFCEDAWLILRLRNYVSHLAEKESNCKYYFIDNGILNLFLIDKESILLENLVALTLFRRLGHDSDNERVFFFNDDYEVDFYIPESETAIQVCYSIADQETLHREVTALTKLSKRVPCQHRIILTYDDTQQLNDEFGPIDVLPVWKWGIL